MSKAKKTTGPLSKADYYSVFEQTSQGKSAEEIAESIGKSIKSVEKAIAKNKSMIAKVVEESPIIDSSNFEDSKLYRSVLSKLKKSGLEIDVAKNRLNEIFNKIAPKNMNGVTEEDLFKAAMNKMSGKELFINKTAGNNNGGVAVLTNAASEAADARQGSRAKQLSDAMYKI